MGKAEYLAKLNVFIKKLSKGIKIKEVVFFGSRAAGKEKGDSDFDLIIVSDDFKNLNYFQRGSMMYDYWDLPYPVDFLCYTSKEFNLLKRKISIVSQAVKEGIVLR